MKNLKRHHHPSVLNHFIVIAGLSILMSAPAKSDTDVDQARYGITHGCLKSGAPESFCSCQADEIVTHVPVSELGIFGRDLIHYIRHEIGPSDIPENYHEAIIGIASCKERFAR